MKTNKKKCAKCGVAKLLSEFHRNRSKSDGTISRCKICISDYRRERYQQSRVKEHEQRFHKRRSLEIVRLVLERLGGRCVICGCTELVLLTISHERHDGVAHRKRIGGGSSKIYRWVLKATNKKLKKANLAVRCFNCNCALNRCTEEELRMAIKYEHKRIKENRL